MDLNKSLLNLSSEISSEYSKDQTSSIWSEINESFLQNLEEPFHQENENTSILRNDEQYKGFDNDCGGEYIYPINLPIRTYQYNIIKAALFNNTLIVLPTGLGKTFIAAVVMYNIYRWYPMGKIIFMAPTRPLVHQQIEACRKIMGIPIDNTAEMTGKQNKEKRTDLWHNKRIFFATPQVVQIDINDPELNFPFNSIKLIVVDEAHKAKGRYAYTEVIQTINNRNPYFRVIALSATPGRRIEDVVEIIQNLCISHVEVRCENSIDVQPFIFRKNIKTVLVPLGEQISQIRDELINIIDPFIRNLIDNGVLNGNPGNFTKNWIVMEQKRFKEMSINQRHPKHSSVSTDFSICISLYYALELLERHGVRVFLNFFDDPDQNNQKEKFFVQSNPKLKKFLKNLRKEIGPNPFAINDQTMTNGKIQNIPDNLDFGHPKFDMVRKFLVEHFEEYKTSKVIVFCEFRESVMLLHRLLLQNRPLIVPKVFVGQGGTGSIRAVSQKEQIQVMDDFRNGIINTLIATSVAEEGIDVGEVNLIICFDISSKNPTRFIQRIGRTGRKQQGKVIMLATEGKEHSLVKEVLATRNKVNETLSKSRTIKHILYQRSPRIVPPEFNPKCLELFMKFQNQTSMEKKEKKINNNKKTKKNSTDNVKNVRKRKLKENGPPSQDVRNFFKKIEIPNKEITIFSSPEKQTNHIIQDDDLINVDNINNFSSVTQFEKLNTPSESKKLEPLRLSNEANSNIELNFRKLNHLTRQLDKQQNYPNYSNIEETLQSKNVSKDIKKFILQNNIEFVQEKFEAMQIIWEMDNLSGFDDSEKQIRLIFSHIEAVLGDKNSIENFIQKNSNKNFKKINQIKKLNDKFSGFFEEFEERDFSDSVQGFIEQKMVEIDLNLLEPEEDNIKVVTKPNVNTSIFYESLLENEFDFDFENESKYANQLTQLDNQITNQSTPISKKLKNPNGNILVYSPLAIKLQNEINRNKFSLHGNNVVENETNIIDLSPINSVGAKNNDALKTNCYVTKTPTNYSYSNNLCNIERSADLFDDDFDEIFGSDDILNSIENNCNKTIKHPTKEEETNKSNVISKSEYDSFIKSKFPREEKNKIAIEIGISENDINHMKQMCEHRKYNSFHEISPITSRNDHTAESMIEIDKILEIVAESEKAAKDKHKTINPDLENFDLNDFLEPFENENDWSDILEPFEEENDWKENSFKENTTATIQKGAITRQLSDDIFDISSPSKEGQSTKHISSIENSPQETSNDASLIYTSLLVQNKQIHLQSKQMTSKMNTTSTAHIENVNNQSNKMSAAKSFCNISSNAEESIILRPYRKLKNIIEICKSDEEHSGEDSICQLKMKNGWNDNTTTATIQKGAITRKLSDDIFDISSPNKVDQSKHIENSSKETNNDAGLISPSLIGRRKPRYLQLKPLTSKINTISGSVGHIENMNKNSNKMLTAKSLFNISSNTKAMGLKNQKKNAEESIILRPCRKLKNIIESSESDENYGDDDICQLSQEIITPTKTRVLQRRNERKKNLKHCQFLNLEAAHSGNESSNDETCDELNILDSIVVMDGEEEEDDSNVNMHAKYLQSIRSPKHLARGAFKIPPHREFMDLSQILSQPVQPDDTYKYCSFVVSDDDVFDGEVTEICPLEEAEAILKAKRKAKRKQLNVHNKRRRIINDFIEISDDDD